MHDCFTECVFKTRFVEYLPSNMYLSLHSVMRALGVPTRSVTNYDSAHDTDNNLTFDKYLDEEGYYLDDESDDSCWYVLSLLFHS